MSIKNRAAEGHMLGAVAITTPCHVPAAEHELKLAAARLAKDGDALLVAKAANVVIELLIEAPVPLRRRDALEDAADHRLLIGCVEVALDGGLGDAPVVFQPRAQQPALRVHIVPGKAYLLPLLRLQRFIEQLHDGLGLLGCRKERTRSGSECCQRCRGAEKRAAAEMGINVRETIDSAEMWQGCAFLY